MIIGKCRIKVAANVEALVFVAEFGKRPAGYKCRIKI